MSQGFGRDDVEFPPETRGLDARMKCCRNVVRNYRPSLCCRLHQDCRQCDYEEIMICRVGYSLNISCNKSSDIFPILTILSQKAGIMLLLLLIQHLLN